MSTPHKHADVLRAIADGKEVQWRDTPLGPWFDEAGPLTPLTHAHLEWRVKPEPKPDVVVGERVLYSQYCGARFVEDSTHNLRLTFDGETGALKKAEVIE